MYLWDSNILRHFADGHPVLYEHLIRVPWNEIALPSVLVAESLRGRCDFALKVHLEQAPDAHRLLMQTYQLLQQFNVLVFDTHCFEVMKRLKQKAKSNKRYADMMIAAMAIAGDHVVVTRNQRHFVDLLPKRQLTNWVDVLP